jgi:hypothetical protein
MAHLTVASKRSRRRFKPEQPSAVSDAGSNHHAMFDHVPGGTLCTSMFKHFTLPDGSTKHLYHPKKKWVDELDVPPEPAPPPPATMEEALQVSPLYLYLSSE